MTDFKPDYLCDPPCCYHAALQESLETIKSQADEIERLRDELKCYVSEAYPFRNKYPNEMRRYKRDMKALGLSDD